MIRTQSLALAMAIHMALCICLAAQSFPIRWSATTNSPGHRSLGATTIGDINADGFPDIATRSVLSTTTAGGIGQFQMDFHCGKSGQHIRSSPLEPHPWNGGVPPVPVHNVGDLDGDGLDDVLTFTFVSSVFDREIRTYSSATGAQLLAAPFPSSARFQPRGDMSVTIPDRNGDGVREVATFAVASGPTGAPEGVLVIFDPMTGTNLLPSDIQLGPIAFNPPKKVFDVDDINNDGVPDLFVSLAIQSAGKRITLISGMDFSIISSVVVPAREVTGVIGDTDGDGEVECGFTDGTTSVVFINIPSGTASTTVLLPPPGPFISNLDPHTQNLGDINGDEVDDFSLIIRSFSTTFRIYSGQTYDRLRVGVDSVEILQLVETMKLGDIDVDGADEFITCQNGLFRAMSLAGALAYGDPSASLPLQLRWTESATTGTTIGTVDVTGAQPFGTGLVAVSQSDDATMVGGLQILVDANALALEPAIVSFDALGRFSSPLALGIPALEGTSLFAQVFDVTNPQVTSSNGLELYFTLP